jgi:hypothetical protein
VGRRHREEQVVAATNRNTVGHSGCLHTEDLGRSRKVILGSKAEHAQSKLRVKLVTCKSVLLEQKEDKEKMKS